MYLALKCPILAALRKFCKIREKHFGFSNPVCSTTPSRTTYRSRRHFYVLIYTASHSLRRSGFSPKMPLRVIFGDPFYSQALYRLRCPFLYLKFGHRRSRRCSAFSPKMLTHFRGPLLAPSGAFIFAQGMGEKSCSKRLESYIAAESMASTILIKRQIVRAL